MMRLFRSRKFWAIFGSGIAMFAYFGWRIYSTSQQIGPKPNSSTNTSSDSAVIDLQKGVIQPARELQTGPGVVYHSTPEPTPQPEKSPASEKTIYPPLVLCDFPMPAATPTPVSVKEEQLQDDRFLSRFTFIPVKLLVELDSSHMTTPILAIVTEDIWQQTSEGKKLIIEAGCKIGGFLTPGYIRDKVEIKGELTLIFLDGLELTFQGIFCDREYDFWTHHYGLYDKSGGVKGQLVEKDNMVFLRNLLGYLANLVSKGVDAGAGAATATLLQQGRNGNVSSIQVNPGQAVVAPFSENIIEKMINPLQLADTVFVQVPSGKNAYVVNTTKIQPGLRSEGAELQMRMKKREEEAEKHEENASFNLKNAQKLLQDSLKQVSNQEESKDEPKSDPNAVLK